MRNEPRRAASSQTRYLDNAYTHTLKPPKCRLSGLCPAPCRRPFRLAVTPPCRLLRRTARKFAATACGPVWVGPLAMLTSDLGPAWDIAGGAGAVRPRRTSKRAARDGESSPTSSLVPAHAPRKRPSAQRAEPAASSEAGTGRAVDSAPTRRDKRAPTHRREQPSDIVSSDSECTPRRRRPAQQPRRGDAAAPSPAATSASDAQQSTERQRPEPPHQRKPTVQQAAFAALVEKVHRRMPPPSPFLPIASHAAAGRCRYEQRKLPSISKPTRN